MIRDLDLLERFDQPGREFGPLPIWWWSGARVTSDRLRWQMEQLLAQGVRQAVVMCLAPAGPLVGALADDPPFLSPEWLRLLDQACADAHELGFTLWMYDQIGFSGANFQGRLIAEHPEFAGQALYRTSVPRAARADPVCPVGHTPLHTYESEDAVTLVHAGVRGFDYFNPKAGGALLNQVHGELERHVGRWFGRSIGGFFQDELPAMPTWGSDFAATFEAEYGYDLVPRLDALFEGDSDAAAAVRRDYHEHRARLARRGFFDQHDAWYAERGLICGFDQASPAREGDPVGGVHLYGDYLGTHSGYGAPGSDHWGDSKVHSSLAHAHGRPRTWIEAFHSSGWGGTLEETYDWLAPFLRRGATLYNPHAVYYSTVGGWWEWAPPSTCWRQPYWPSYHVFATAIARLCSVLSAGVHVCDTMLVSPTTTAQAYLTLDGPLPPATRTAEVFHELNGVPCWFAERRGQLEAAGIDHDVVDENTIAVGVIVDGRLQVGAESYETVVLPAAAAVNAAAAARLAELARAGGRVICVGEPPATRLGAETPDDFARVVREGLITVVATAAEVPAAVRANQSAGSLRVDADAPFLLRRVGDLHVLMLAAHDDISGTAGPSLDMGEPDWWSSGINWDGYWRQLRETGYTFVPVGDRRARVRIKGLGSTPRAQRWDPRSGARTDLHVRPDETDDGTASWRLDVPFEDGPISLVVFGDELPEATRTALGPAVRAGPVNGPWTAHAESTLDNRFGDLAASSRATAALPIEVWRLEHRDDPAAEWKPVVATFGPFAEITEVPASEPAGSAPHWRPVEWSLSRGLHNDPVHLDTLGPKGYVPEEFLDWRRVPAGTRVAARTHLTVPPTPQAYLAVGANAARTVRLDGTPVPVNGGGYLSFSPLPTGTTVRVELEFTADRTGPLRASFAVVADPEAYRRPEFLVPADEPVVGQSTDLTYRLELAAVPTDSTFQVTSDGPCSVLVNGVEIGRQGDYGPYPGFRELQIHAYDPRDRLSSGPNLLTLRVMNTSTEPTAAALDSAGLGVQSGAGWAAARDGGTVPLQLRRSQGDRDPRVRYTRPRPHPLPGAGWLAPAPTDGVIPVIPNLSPARAGASRTEWLRLSAPLGTTAMRVPTELEFVAHVDGTTYHPVDGRVALNAPLPAGTPVVLEFAAGDGRRGGALLDGAVEVEVATAQTTLASWEDLGLRGLGGQVTYRTTIRRQSPVEPARTLLDLGEVRGTADVLVDGVLVDRLVWGPWVCELTDALRAGELDASGAPDEAELEIVVRGTLAGYLDDASPTMAVAAGQVRTGLFGPVRLSYHQKAG